MKKIIDYLAYPPLSGFAVAIFTAVFIHQGIFFVLFLFERWQLSTINTVIFYGILFIIARARVQVKSDERETFDENIPWDEIEDFTKEKDQPSLWKKLSRVIWVFFGLYSVLWVTPALIVYWMYDPPFPKERILFIVYLLSVAACIVYFFSNQDKFKSTSEKSIYFVGAFLGPFAAIYVMV